jgi:hypothetical protein
LCLIKRYSQGVEKADILRYSLSQDEVVKVSNLTLAAYGGLALLANDGKSIYYFQGTVVHKFDCMSNLTVRLPTALPSSVQDAGGVSLNGTIFIFNGGQGTILEFNETSETGRVIGDLPFRPGTLPVSSTTAIWKGDDRVWLFAGNYPKAMNPILSFDTAKKVVIIPSANSTSPPTLYAVPASVRSSSPGYLIGGLGRVPEINGSYHPMNGILR